MAKEITIIIQYSIKGLGTKDDLARRYRIEKLIEAALASKDDGECSGGDMGNDKMNIFIDDITDITTVFETISQTLESSGDLDDAIIAVNVFDDETESENSGYEVLWPKSYHGIFDVL